MDSSLPAAAAQEHEHGKLSKEQELPGSSGHSHLNGRQCHLAEELSVQQTSNSNSSLGGGSACSLVNNESLGLDERGIFEQFDMRER